MHRPAEKHIAFRTPRFPSTASLYLSERATIALSHPRLSPFNDCGNPHGAFFRVTLPRWYTGTFVPYILPQTS